jgi:hypothetical protein
MSDVQLLFVVLAALYAWECAIWLRRGSVGFATWLGSGWHVAHPGAMAGNAGGGFFLSAPLPPLGTLLVSHQFPLSLSPVGALAFVPTHVNPGWRPAQSGRFARWEQLGCIEARGRRLFLNGELFLAAATPGYARHLGAVLQRLAKLTATHREDAIVAVLRDTLDVKLIESRLGKLRSRNRALRVLCNALFFHLLLLTPGLIWAFGFGPAWPGLLASALALTISTAICFHRAHRALYPEADDERFTHTLTIALSPASALRALDALSRPLLENFHPLAVAASLLPEHPLRTFARRILLDLRHPALPTVPNPAAEVVATEVYSRRTLLLAVEDVLERSGLSPDELGGAPASLDDSCRSYCPRCDAQFTAAAGQCADCGGLTLVELQKRDNG